MLLFCSCSFYKKKYRIGIGLLLGFLRLKNPGTEDRAHQIFQNKIKFTVMELAWTWWWWLSREHFLELMSNSSFSRDKEKDAQRKEYRQEEMSDLCLLIVVVCRKIKLMVYMLVNRPTGADLRAVHTSQLLAWNHKVEWWKNSGFLTAISDMLILSIP